MSDNDKPYIGIKLSKTPEPPESVRAQEDAIRAAADPLLEWARRDLDANVQAMHEMQPRVEEVLEQLREERP